MTAALGIVGAFAMLAGYALYLAVSRGGARTRTATIEAQLVALAREHANYVTHMDKQLAAQGVSVETYESEIMPALAKSGGDYRNVLAALSGSVPPTADSGDGADAGGVSADEGSTGHTAPGSGLLGPRLGLLGSADGAGGSAVGDSSSGVD